MPSRAPNSVYDTKSDCIEAALVLYYHQHQERSVCAEPGNLAMEIAKVPWAD